MIRSILIGVAFSLLVLTSTITAQRAEVAPDGQHIVKFTTGQQTAIDQFLKTHPGMLQADCTTLGFDAATCAEVYRDWHETAEGAHAVPQSPYAVWGNYSHHESPDLVVPFFSKTSVNNWNWRRWEVVAFEPIGPDRYKPIVAVTGSWGTCFDGMIYHPTRKRVEFWCKSMGGDIRWNGTTFVGKLAKGD